MPRILGLLFLVFFLASCAAITNNTSNKKYQLYIWQKGDTLEQVAKKFGDNVLELRRRNHIYEPEDLYAGFKLLVTTKKRRPTIKKSQPNKIFFIRPTKGSTTSKYGWRKGGFHYGVDFGADKGKRIVASGKGIVKKIGYQKGYGKTIEIQHSKNVKTLYAHLEKILVRKNQRVDLGQTIGIMGNTGKSTGIHLHFEIIVNDKAIDPFRVIKNTN